MRLPLHAVLLSTSVTGAIVATAIPLGAQEKQTIEGIRNFTQVEASIGCGGATSPDAMPELKRRGFVAIINFRLASEPNADIEAARAAAEQTGLKYIHLPFNLSIPNPERQVEAFLDSVVDENNQPAYIHCASANRVGGVWLIKRVLQDGWDEARALAEAEIIGLTNPRMRDFALAYVRAR